MSVFLRLAGAVADLQVDNIQVEQGDVEVIDGTDATMIRSKSFATDITSDLIELKGRAVCTLEFFGGDARVTVSPDSVRLKRALSSVEHWALGGALAHRLGAKLQRDDVAIENISRNDPRSFNIKRVSAAEIERRDGDWLKGVLMVWDNNQAEYQKFDWAWYEAEGIAGDECLEVQERRKDPPGLAQQLNRLYAQLLLGEAPGQDVIEPG